jgi:hypothetical protein
MEIFAAYDWKPFQSCFCHNIPLFKRVLLISDGYTFSTCGRISGPMGPLNRDCDDAYLGAPTQVMIGDSSRIGTEFHHLGHVTGIQRWKVPQSGLYT